MSALAIEELEEDEAIDFRLDLYERVLKLHQELIKTSYN